jgi:hypothetical protein
MRRVVHLEIRLGEESRIYVCMLIAESSESERQSKRRVEDLENKVGDRLKGNQCRAELKYLERRVEHEKRDRKNPVSGNWGRSRGEAMKSRTDLEREAIDTLCLETGAG